MSYNAKESSEWYEQKKETEQAAKIYKGWEKMIAYCPEDIYSDFFDLYRNAGSLCKSLSDSQQKACVHKALNALEDTLIGLQSKHNRNTDW